MAATSPLIFVDERHWVVNLHTMRVVDCSEPAARMWGYSAREMVGVRAETLLHPEELQRARALRAEHLSGDCGIWKCLRRDGSAFYAHILVGKGVRNGRLCTFAQIGGGGIASSRAEVEWVLHRVQPHQAPSAS